MPEITRSEIEMLIASAAQKSQRDAAIIALVGACGLKTGELRVLRSEHLEDGELAVSGRRFKLEPELLRLLSSSEMGFIFKGRDGRRPISSKQIQNVIKEHSLSVFGRKLKPADLRKAFAREQLSRGRSKKELKEMLGHAHISTTERLLD